MPKGPSEIIRKGNMRSAAPAPSMPMPGRAPMNMPDPAVMSGIPLPAADLPTGTVRVRVVRDAITSVLPGVEVVLRKAEGDGQALQRQKTGETGHVELTGLAAQTTYILSADIEGKEIVSRPFTMPPSGGFKFMLSGKAAARGGGPGTAADGAADSPAGHVGPTTKDLSKLVLAPGSHLAIEFGDAEVQVVAHFVIANRGDLPVDVTPAGLRFPLPEGFYGAQPAGEPSPLLFLSEQGAFLKGPVPQGETILRFAYSLPTRGNELLLRQTIPLATQGMRVIVEKLNGLTVEGPTAERIVEREFEGRSFLLVGHEHEVPPGQTVEVLLRGVPSHDRTLPYASVALSILMIAVTAVVARKGKAEAGT